MLVMNMILGLIVQVAIMVGLGIGLGFLVFKSHKNHGKVGLFASTVVSIVLIGSVSYGMAKLFTYLILGGV
jgi:hypothetical protein